MRDLRAHEMMAEEERDKKRQELRNERAKRDIPIQKKVFQKSFVQPRKKTHVQEELEKKLKQK